MTTKIDYYIRSSEHITAFANTGKKYTLNYVVVEMRRVMQIMVDHLWQQGLNWTGQPPRPEGRGLG